MFSRGFLQRLACVAGVRRVGKAGGGGEDERAGRGRIGRGSIAVGDTFKTHSTVECQTVKIVQSESNRFFRDKVCRRQRVLVFNYNNVCIEFAK